MLYVIERIEISSLANSFSKNLKRNQSCQSSMTKCITTAKASLSLVVPSKKINVLPFDFIANYCLFMLLNKRDQI